VLIEHVLPRMTMAKRNATLKPREDRNPSPAVSSAPASPTNAVDLPPTASATLEAAIEAERSQLMELYAVLRCLYDVLLYVDDEESVLHADAVKLVARLIDQSVSQLEWSRLEPLVEKARQEPRLSKGYEVRDAAPREYPLKLSREDAVIRLRTLVRELQGGAKADFPNGYSGVSCSRTVGRSSPTVGWMRMWR
jgi:hypothetical protein